MLVNQLEAVCVICRNLIPPRGGNDVTVVIPGLDMPGIRLSGWGHPVCITAIKRGDQTPQVVAVPGGVQNVKGRCQDAPCCGCCYP